MILVDHYYTQKPSTTSQPKYWSYQLRGNSFQFKTDRGVFSKNEVDFGSKLLIHAFELPSMKGPILDVGCGYGPIGLAIARSFPDIQVHMIDINERAVQLAKENAAQNHIDNIKIFESDGFTNVTEFNYAAIVTNPPIRAGKKVVFEIIEESYKHLKPGGQFWAVIQKKQGAPSAKKKIEEVFGEAEIVKKEKGYYILKAKKFDSHESMC